MHVRWRRKLPFLVIECFASSNQVGGLSYRRAFTYRTFCTAAVHLAYVWPIHALYDPPIFTDTNLPGYSEAEPHVIGVDQRQELECCRDQPSVMWNIGSHIIYAVYFWKALGAFQIDH